MKLLIFRKGLCIFILTLRIQLDIWVSMVRLNSLLVQLLLNERVGFKVENLCFIWFEILEFHLLTNIKCPFSVSSDLKHPPLGSIL